MTRYRLMLVGVVLAAVAASYAWVHHRQQHTSSETAHTPAIESFTLSNGMEVVVVPNHRIPAVSHTLWLKVGAADDPQGASGLAHYLEHLMFEGTPDHQGGAYDRTLEALGGSFNAFTGADYTGYYVNIATEHLERVMQMESDRLRHLNPSEASFKRERKVIIEERKSRTENNPRALLMEEMNAALFRHHPYGIPIIGWMHEMETLSATDAMDFYRRYYHAGNLLLVVAGDITRRELEPLAERYYGTLKAGAPYQRRWTQEPPQRAARRLVMHHEQVQQPLWARAYAAPSLLTGHTADALPLELFALWLGDANTGQLYRELVVKQRVAVSVSVGYGAMAVGPSKLVITAMAADGTSLAALERAIDEQLAQLRHTTMAEDDLARLKTLMKAEILYARDGLEPVARMVGALRALGLGVDYFTQWTQKIDAVTAQQIQQAAARVLKSEASVTATLLPAPAGGEDAHDR